MAAKEIRYKCVAIYNNLKLNYEIFKEVPDLYDEMPEIESFCNFMQSGRNPSLFQELTVASYGDKKMDVKIMGASETFFDFFTLGGSYYGLRFGYGS